MLTEILRQSHSELQVTSQFSTTEKEENQTIEISRRRLKQNKKIFVEVYPEIQVSQKTMENIKFQTDFFFE